MGKDSKMADFRTIETQEELDRIIGERLEREKSKAEKATESLKTEIESLKKTLSESESKVKTLTETQNGHADEVAKLTSEIASYKLKAIKHEIAHQNGLPYELADRLTGDTEELLRADAETLKGLINTNKTPSAPPPVFRSEKEPGDERREELLKTLDKLQRRK